MFRKNYQTWNPFFAKTTKHLLHFKFKSLTLLKSVHFSFHVVNKCKNDYMFRSRKPQSVQNCKLFVQFTFIFDKKCTNYIMWNSILSSNP